MLQAYYFRRITVVVRIAINIVRVGVLIELALGILFWTGNADSLQIVHIVIGILVVLSLWTLGIAQGLQGGSFGLALATWFKPLDHSGHTSSSRAFRNWLSRNDQWTLSQNDCKQSHCLIVFQVTPPLLSHF